MRKFLLGLLLFIILIIMGCSQEVDRTINQTETTIEENITKELVFACGDAKCDEDENHATCPEDCEWTEVSELALTLEDFPEGFSIQIRGPRIKDEVSKEAQALGWKEGYMIKVFNKDSGVTVEQYISIYPKKDIKKVLDLTRKDIEEARVIESSYIYTYSQLSGEKIGEDSLIYRFTTEDIYSNMIAVEYIINFVKGEVYESISTTDFELLGDLAKKAERKI